MKISDLETLEREFPEGLTSHQIVELFAHEGVHLSEATLRKYIQLGLLPRSRRVGVKGKHRGSLGLYPIEVVRRIAWLKQQMNEGRTLDEIRELLSQTVDLHRLRAEISVVLGAFETRLARSSAPAIKRREWLRELAAVRSDAAALLARMERLDHEGKPVLRRPAVAIPPAPPRTFGKG